ncbi:unnamed protein product [Linum tenue]|uniref:Uncharacterized protein n=1 Tax=Linum tenue TaxID=586396 RepID=A0AAV0KU43_9ROSI|nr:unnamed protein product [Linum tenue]
MANTNSLKMKKQLHILMAICLIVAMLFSPNFMHSSEASRRRQLTQRPPGLAFAPPLCPICPCCRADPDGVCCKNCC